jgi:hypothetical protein
MISNISQTTTNTSFDTREALRSTEDKHGFGKVIRDTLNPLQHIPIVGNVYRQATGDTLHPVSRIAVGTALGGLVGAAVALVTSIVSEATAKPEEGTTTPDPLLTLDEAPAVENPGSVGTYPSIVTSAPGNTDPVTAVPNETLQNEVFAQLDARRATEIYNDEEERRRVGKRNGILPLPSAV